MTQYQTVKMFRSVLSFLPSKRRKQFVVLFLGMVAAGGIETVAIGSIAFFVSSVSDPKAIMQSFYWIRLQQIWQVDFLHNTEGLLIFLSVIMVGLVIAKNLVRGVITYASGRYSAYIGSYMGEKLLAGFLYAPHEWHLSKNSADLAISVMWRLFFGQLSDSVLLILSEFIVVSVLLIAILLVEPFVSLIVICVIGLSAFIVFNRTRIALDRIIQRLRDFRISINQEVTKAIHGIKDVKIYGKEDVFLTDYSTRAYVEARMNALQIVLGQMPAWILEICGFLMLGITICFLSYYMKASAARLTGIVALLAVTAWRVLPAVNKILGRLVQARSALPYVQKGLDYLTEISLMSALSVSAKHQDDVQFIFLYSMRFENVSFIYHGAGRQVLNQVDFTIDKGASVGIVGVSGAGKSTLVDLLIGLIVPTTGRILVDGHALDNTIAASWARKIGYVAQSPYIFDGTIAENVAFGFKGEDINREQVLTCCDMAAMGDFLAGMPDSIDTAIGERGVKLSGGQRQRVAIARALYHQPEVMIFDEATSSLDAQSEKAIQETIYSFKGKQTLIVIAHRLSTVEHCDKLIWLENGFVHKIGPSDAILPEYRRYMREKH